MMEFDWKQAVSIIAPGLGTLLGGPLAGGAIKILADAVLGGSSGDLNKDEAELATVIQSGITPELRAKILEADAQVRIAMIQADVRKTEVAADVEKSYLLDVANARGAHANTVGILRLGYLINIASYSIVLVVLYGCYKVITGADMGKIDAGLAATVGTLVGGTVQWLLSNAQSANNFFFGSSPSGRANSTAIASGVSKAVATTTEVKK